MPIEDWEYTCKWHPYYNPTIQFPLMMKGLRMNDMVNKIEHKIEDMAHKSADAVKHAAQHAADKLPWHKHHEEHKEDVKEGSGMQEAPTTASTPYVKT